MAKDKDLIDTPAPTKPAPKTCVALVLIQSTAGDFKPGETIPNSVPEYARKAWVSSGRAELR